MEATASLKIDKKKKGIEVNLSFNFVLDGYRYCTEDIADARRVIFFFIRRAIKHTRINETGMILT